MGVFDEREKAFEAKYSYESEVEFRVCSRRARLIGLWAAEQMGMASNDAEAYARDALDADLKNASHSELLRKIEEDLRLHGVEVSEHRLERKMSELFNIARTQIMTGE